jgi:hypothetical protein
VLVFQSVSLQFSHLLDGNLFISSFFRVLFALFCGVGFSALPIDLINEYRGRPLKIDAQCWEMKRSGLKTDVTQLIESGKQVEEELVESQRKTGWRNKTFILIAVSCRKKSQIKSTKELKKA